MNTDELGVAESGIHLRVVRAFRAIVADDDPLVRRVVARLLRGVGYTVDEVDDGAALVATVRAQCARDGAPPELVLTDVSMPHCNGLDALSLLSPTLGASMVFVMTANANEHVYRRARDLGARAVFEKPFRLDEVRDVIVGLRATGT